MMYIKYVIYLFLLIWFVWYLALVYHVIKLKMPKDISVKTLYLYSFIAAINILIIVYYFAGMDWS